MAKIQLIQGADNVLQTFEMLDARPYHYTLNRGGAGFLGVLALLMLAGATALALIMGLHHPIWLIAVALLVACALLMVAQIWRWSRFADRSFLAITDDHLYIGDREQVWQIHWDLLDTEALGFERMALSAAGGSLQVRAGGQDIDLHLYGALASLRDLQGFMQQVLLRLKEREALEDPSMTPPLEETIDPSTAKELA